MTQSEESFKVTSLTDVVTRAAKQQIMGVFAPWLVLNTVSYSGIAVEQSVVCL